MTERQHGARAIQRTFQVLETLARLRSPPKPKTLADELDLPLSSMLDILKGMVAAGYLVFDPTLRTYSPSPRIMLLCNELGGDAQALRLVDRLMRELAEETHETIVLAVSTGFEMEAVKVITSPQPLTLNVPAGLRMPIEGSALGRAHLATLPRADARKILLRLERNRSSLHLDGMPVSDFVSHLAQQAKCGFVTNYDGYTKGIGAIARGLPPAYFRQPMAISIGGPTDRIRSAERVFGRLLASRVEATMETLRHR